MMFTDAQLEIKSIRGLIEDYRDREAQIREKIKRHPLALEYSRQSRQTKNAMHQAAQTADFLEAYLAILDKRSDL